MGSKHEQGERKESALSLFVSGIKKKTLISFLIIGIIALSVAAIVLIVLNLWFWAILSTVIIIPCIIIVVRDYYKTILSQENKIVEMQGVIEQKEEYISAFSHRIRTPLNNFSFIIDYLMDSNPEESQKEMLETLIASTTNMVEAVNDLSMRTAQLVSYAPRKDIIFNLSSALLSTIELFEANTDNSINFKIEQTGNLSRRYLGDPITIKQIFLDVFSSISSEDESPSEVTVILENDGNSSENEKIKLSIISDRAIPAFDTDNSKMAQSDNMALKLIDGINGTYDYTVSNGKSAFSFTLPLIIAPEEQSQSKAAERIKELHTGSKVQKILLDANILLVEDNPTNQKIVLITLSSLVKNIDTAETGKEALDHFGKSNYDIILMDIQLPVMDGITVAKKIREIEKSTSQHTPIIAITANAMIGDKEKCLSAGIDEYLSKPFQPSQLIKIIESFVTA